LRVVTRLCSERVRLLRVRGDHLCLFGGPLVRASVALRPLQEQTVYNSRDYLLRATQYCVAAFRSLRRWPAPPCCCCRPPVASPLCHRVDAPGTKEDDYLHGTSDIILLPQPVTGNSPISDYSLPEVASCFLNRPVVLSGTSV
jgi:hypothetical protein